jgi:hypothetical protein
VRPWLSIVIPTVGRPSLCDTLDAIDQQPAELLKGVEVLIVADTYQTGMTANLLQVREHLETERVAGRYRFLEHDGGQHIFGQPQRTYGAQQALGEWVWFGQDDNIATREALAAIAHATRSHISELILFRWVSPWRETIWRWPDLELGNLDADCLVFSQRLARQITWGLRYEGDYDAACQAWDLIDRGEIDWRSTIVSVARPGQEHRWWQWSTAVA